MELNPIGPNQTELRLGSEVVIFFSYKTPVAAFVSGEFYRTTAKYSATTSRHISAWLAGVRATPKPPEFFEQLFSHACLR